MAYTIFNDITSDGIILTNDSMNVFEGGLANNTTIFSGGRLYVTEGGWADHTIVNSGGNISVYEGGMVDYTTVNSMGSLQVFNGGFANHTTLNSGGYANISEMASAENTIVNGYMYVYFLGSANHTTVNSRGWFIIEDGGIGNDITVNPGGSIAVEAGGTATEIVVSSGGVLGIDVATYTYAKGTSNGIAFEMKDAFLSDYTINTGYLNVRWGGMATKIAVNSGGGMYVYEDGVVTGVTVNSGGGMYVYDGVVTDVTVNSGGTIDVSVGGTATEIIVSSGGRLGFDVAPDTYAKGTSGGVAFELKDAYVSDYTINSGNLGVYQGGVTENITVNSNGYMYVASGGIANGIIENGGYVRIEANATVAFVPNTINELVLSNASATVHSGTIANNITVNSNGSMLVFSGGSVDNTTVNSSGWFYLSSGGTANALTVNPGGTIYVSSGGTALQIRENGGRVYVYSGGVVEFAPSILNGLELTDEVSIHSGTVMNDVVLNGGNCYVSSAGEVNGITVNSGGYLYVSSGGTALQIKENGGYVSENSNTEVSFIPNTIVGMELTYATIHSGTTAIDATVNRDGTLIIKSGGTALQLKENGGWINIEEGADVSFQSNTFSGISLNRGATVHSGTEAIDTVINSAGNLTIFNGGAATGTILNFSGRMYVSSGGNASDVTINSGGSLQLYSGGKASTIAVKSGGSFYVSSKCSANDIIVNQNAKLVVSSGGIATNIRENGGQVYLDSGVSATFAPNVFSGITLSRYDTTTVHSGTVGSDCLLTGGQMYIYQGGAVDTVTVEYGARLEVHGGTATAIKENGGYVFASSGTEISFIPNTFSGLTISNVVTVHSGTTANEIVVVSGGLYVYSGGVANHTTVSNGFYVYSGGVANYTIVDRTGRNNFLGSGAVANYTTLNGGITYLNPGGVVNDTVINSGYLDVSSCAELNRTTINSGGRLLLHLSGIVANDTVVNAYASMSISRGAKANGNVIQSFGSMYIFSGGIANDNRINSKGSMYVSNGGVANIVSVCFGGSMNVCPGGTVNELIVDSGGVLYVSSGGVAANIIADSGARMSLVVAPNTRINGVVDGSAFTISNGQVSDYNIISGVELLVYSNAVADHIAISSGGRLDVSGGTANNLVLSSDGTLKLNSNAQINSLCILDGGELQIGNNQDLIMVGGSSAVFNKIEKGLVTGTVQGGIFSGTMQLQNGASLTGIGGQLNLALATSGNYSFTGCDLSQANFSFAAGATADLSGNYWGTTDIDAIYAKLGVDTSRVVIEDVLLTDPTTVFSIVSNNLNHNYMGEGTDCIVFAFSHEIDATTVNAEALSLVSTSGGTVQITEVSVDGKQLTVKFNPLTVEGNYRLAFADTITDIAGAPLVSLRETGLADGVGELLNLRADFTSPYVVKVSPDGDFAGTLTTFTVHFSGAVDPLTIAGNVQLITPNGSGIAPTTYKAISNSSIEFTVPGQTAYGTYQIRVSNNVADYAGNQLDQNQNGIGGEANDSFISGFVIADVNLKIQNLELSKTTLSLGETVTINWEVINSSGYALYGSWTDGVYLSKDARWDVNDILLGSVTHPDGLGENQTLDSSLTVNLSGVKEGDYYLLVRSDIYMQEQTNREAADAAQNLEAAAITVAIPQMTQDVAMTGAIHKNGDFAYYKVHQDANQSLKLVLDSLVGSANMELYVGFDSAPTTEIYDKKVTGIVDGSIFLDAQLSERDVYIMVRAKKTSSEFDYTLTAQSVPMSITKITGTEQGNRTTTYLDVSGVDFAADSTVFLKGATGNTVAPTTLHFINSTRMKLEFEAGTLAPGDYALTVVSGTETATADETITIVDESGAHLDVSLNLPARVGYHLLATITVDYANTGYDASDAILVMVSPSQNNADGITRNGAIMTLNQSLVNDGFWVKTLPEGFSTSVSFLASGESAGLIMPGEILSVDIYYTGWLQNYNGSWDFSYPAIDWNAKYITSDNEEEIDWNSFFDSNEYSAEYRAFLTKAFQNSIGTTWGDYVRMLSKNLQYLDNLGFSPAASSNTHAVDTNALYTFELKQVDGALSPYQKLEDISDLSCGLIHFSREYHSNVSSRYRKSSFGYGWSCNWDISLSFDEEGNIILHNGETVTTFQPTFYGTYTALGTGVLVKKSSGYTVATASGEQYQFDKNGLLQSVTDKNKNLITAAYFDGKLSKLTGSDGSSVSLTWNAAGLIESISDSSGKNVNYAYDDNSNLVTAGDQVYTYSTSLDHALTSVGANRRYGYNENGLLADIINGSDEIDLQYGENGEVHETSNTGTDIVYYYGSNNKVLKEVDNVSGVTTKYQYDGTTLLSVTGSDGSSKVYTYDSNGKLLSLAVNGIVVGYTYDAAGNIASYTDENGIKTEYDYDLNRNCIAAYYADGTAEYWDYNANGLLTGYTDVNGLSLQYAYDALGNCISVTLDDSAVTASGLVYGTFTVNGALEDESWLIITNNATGEYQLFHSNNFFFVGNGLEAGEYTVELLSGDSATYFATITIGEDSSLNLSNIALMTGGDLTLSLDVNYTAMNDIIAVNLYQDDIIVATTYLDESGEYTLSNIAPGDYLLKVESIIYPQFNLEQAVSIQSAETTGIALSIGCGATLSGTIVDANGKAHAGMMLELVCGEDSQFVCTDMNGSYRFDNIVVGEYYLSFADTNQIVDTISVNAEDKTINRNIFTDYSASVSGWLTNEDNVIENGMVYLFQNDRILSCVTTVDGYYQFSFRESGSYSIYAISESGKKYTGSISIQEGDYFSHDIVFTSDSLSSVPVFADYGEANFTLTSSNQNSTSSNSDSYPELTWGDRFAYLWNWGNASDLNNLIKQYNALRIIGDSLIINRPNEVDSEHRYFWDEYSTCVGNYNDFKNIAESNLWEIEKNISKSAVDRWGKFNEVLSEVRKACARKFSGTWLGPAMTLLDKAMEYAIDYVDGNGKTIPMKITADVIEMVIGKIDQVYSKAYALAIKVMDKNKSHLWDCRDTIADLQQLRNEAKPILEFLNNADREYYHALDGFLTKFGDKIKIAFDILLVIDNVCFVYEQTVTSLNIEKKILETSSLLSSMSDHIGRIQKLFPLPACPCDVCPHCNSVLCDGEVLITYADHWEHKNICTGETICSGTYDPNDILGPEGHGEEGYIAKQAMDYTIQFENDPEWANSPVKWVRVYNTLDKGLNPETVQFREVCLAGNLIKLDGQSSYNQRTTITVEGKKITVDVKLNVVWIDETESWQIVAEVMAIDPETGFMLQNVDLGFLFPNDESGRGDGHIRYTVELADDVTTGTVISNSAQIFFDFNEPIDTPVWINTIDADAPSAATFTANASTENTEITLLLTAEDACSGISGFNVRYSTDGITYTDYGFVVGTELIFTGDSAATYYFIAQAVDNAGNKSNWSESVSVQTKNMGYPVLPEDLTVSVDGYSAGFTWSVVDGGNVAGYKLVVDGSEYTTSVTCFSIDDLAIGRHTYKLCAYNTAGLETWTETRNFSVSDVTAPMLNGIPAANVSGNSVTISWAEATDNVRVTGYKLIVGEAVYTTKSTSYSLDDVYFGDYSCRICAVDAAGNEAWSEGQNFSVKRAVLSNDVLLPHVVPHVDYAGGCVPTAVGMLLWYYDQYGYDGYCVAKLVKGTISVIDGVADETLVNFIASDGHSEHFLDKSSEEELQYTVDLSTKQLLTASWDCLADWLGTSQYWRGNSDYATSFYSQSLSWLMSTPQIYNVGGYSLSAKNADFKYGLSLYLNTIGYSLDADATRSVSASDYSFDEFKAEIDAGHVVLVSLSSPYGGHMVTAYGYNSGTQEIIFDDAYSRDCRMIWGGTYSLNNSSYSISAITIIAFDTEGLPTDFEAPVLSDSLSATTKGNNLEFTWEKAADSLDVFYTLKVNDVVYENLTENSFILSDVQSGNYTYSLCSYDAAGNYSAWTQAKTIVVSGFDTPLNNLVGSKDKVSWETLTTGEEQRFIVEYSTDNFEHVIQVVTTEKTIDMLDLPAGTYQWRVKAADNNDWLVGEAIISENESATPKVVQSNEDGSDDLFFASPNGTWENIYYAQNVGSINDWTGTNEIISANGKGRIQNLYFGSADPNVLCLTDGENGDAIFVDDVYTELPESVAEHTARLYKIQEVRAGAGDDIVDMTSQRFEYVGDGLTICGGDGDDVIWANKGNNSLFGDAGNDRIVGASGNDVIAGGIGNDSMHGGGGEDLFTFCENWGADTVEQLGTGKVTLWFASGDESKWNAETLTYTDGDNSVTVKGVTSVTLKFGNDGSEQYATLASAGAFEAFTSQKVFEESGKGLLA